jgi:hypothetical protein
MEAPDSVAGIFSTVFLMMIAAPLYFAVQLVRTGFPRPYWTQLKLIFVYGVLTRAMVLPTYWLARVLGWTNSRFAQLAPEDSNAVIGFGAIPVGTAVVWILSSLIFGGIIGWFVIFIGRRFFAAAAPAGSPSRS